MSQLKDKLNNILVDKREEDDIYAGSILSKYQGSSIHASPNEKIIKKNLKLAIDSSLHSSSTKPSNNRN
jgi:hypothetical protein